MLLEDKSVQGVAPWGIEPEGPGLWVVPPDGGMPVKRYQEYLALLSECIFLSHMRSCRMDLILVPRFQWAQV